MTFLLLVIAAMLSGWISSLAWILVCYTNVVLWVHTQGGRVLGWVGAALPTRPVPRDMPNTFEWYSWGPGAVWPAGAAPPSDLSEVLRYAAQEVWHWPYFEFSHRQWSSAPIWLLIGAWIVVVVLINRVLWDRFGPVVRSDRVPGHVFHAGRLEMRVGLWACVAALPIMALWRFERALWEGSILWGPVGRSSFFEPYHGAHLLLLAQVILLHWLIVWAIYRRCLKREIRLGRAVAKPGVTRCLACGYERGDAPRCPECGAGDGHPGQPKTRAPLRCFEWTGWKRRLLSTPAMVAVMVVLFFSPAWLPFVT
jgi:hypothetical protein